MTEYKSTEYPIVEIELPLSKKTIVMRLMRIKEEKIILTADSSNDENELLVAMMICLKNCAVDLNGVDLDNISFFELQYIYLHLRSASIGKIAKLLIDDDYNNIRKHEVVIDITNVNFDYEQLEKNTHIQFTETSGMKMKYPTFSHVKRVMRIKDQTSKTLEYIKCCIKTIYNENSVFEASNMTNEELDEYIDELPALYFTQLKEFIDSIPKITYNIEYENTKGEHRKVVLSDLRNFTV